MIVPLSAPNTVNDKLHPAHFLEVVWCILAEQSEPHREGIRSLSEFEKKPKDLIVSIDQWCESKLRCGKEWHLWAEDENCMLGWRETNQAPDARTKPVTETLILTSETTTERLI